MKIVIFVLVAWKQEHSLQLALCAAEELLCKTQHKYSEWGLGSSFSSQAASWPWSIVVAGTAGEVCEGNTNITILPDYSNKDTCILMSVTDMRTLQVRYWMLRLQTRQSLDSQIHCVLHSQLFFSPLPSILYCLKVNLHVIIHFFLFLQLGTTRFFSL